MSSEAIAGQPLPAGGAIIRLVTAPRALFDWPDAMDQAVRTAYDPETNTVDVTINANVRLSINGDRAEIVAGDDVSVSGGHMTQLSFEQHHTNPAGAAAFGKLMARAFGGMPGAEDAMRVMVEREQQYKGFDEALRRREFYIRAARRALMPRRKKKRGGCGCG